jgi:hypothetical protein
MSLEKQAGSWWTRSSGRAKLFIVAGAIGSVIIVLGLGLGIGLKRSQNAGSSDHPTSTASSTPSPGATTGTFWQPAVKSTWQIALIHPLEINPSAKSTTPDVEIFDIDLFDNPKETFDTLHNIGKKAICYFSAGSYEPNRPDSKNFKPSDKGNELDGWPGERWLDLKSQNVRKIMRKRIELAASKGCDAIDPDNIDAYVSFYVHQNSILKSFVTDLGFVSRTTTTD